jgi:transglutaminase-like putative cysteine protease
VTWRLEITHTTRYRYSAPVLQSYNEARLEPRSDRHQAVLSSRVEVEPTTRVVRHIDYWGTVVHHFDVQVPHQELQVVGRAVVESGTEPAEPGEATWQELDDPELTDQFEELLAPTSVVQASAEILAVAAELRSAHDSPAGAAEAAAAWVNERLEYRHGLTGVHSTVAEVLSTTASACARTSPM